MAVVETDKDVKIKQLEDCLRFAEVMQSQLEETEVQQAKRPQASTNAIISRAREVFKANKLKDTDTIDPTTALEAIRKYCKNDLGMAQAQLDELLATMQNVVSHEKMQLKQL